MPRRAEIVAAAREWLGTPWRHQGRLMGVGVDCIGLCVGVAQAVGVAVADRTDYARRPDGEELVAALVAHLEPVETPEPGDIALFKVEGQPQHVGVVTDLADGLGLVHAYAPGKRVVEHAFSLTWPGPVVGLYRFPGVTR